MLGTSVEANCMEEEGAGSRIGYRHRVSICRRESKETKHWLRMIASANPVRREECEWLSTEAHELSLILSAILLRKTNQP